VNRRLSIFLCAVLLAAALPLSPAAAQTGFIPGPEYQGFGFGKNKVQYRDFDWQIYHSPHFDMYYNEEDEHLLEKVVSFAESAYDQLSRQFDFQIQEPTPFIMYATHAAFEQNNIILNFIPEGIGAFASPVRFRMVMPVDLPDPELMDLILHELTHIFQYHLLFQGSLTRALTNRAPTWLMEGMASFMAQDESARDRMFLRDAVVNDQIPPMTRWSGGGFFAYRMGHALFDFIVDRWGYEGYIDFVYEYRNTLGGGVGRAVERTFRIDPEEFDDEFRLWLRKRYLPTLLETGEPGEFGRPFRHETGRVSTEISPTASPSGDLVAAFSVSAGDVDVALFDAVNRRYVRNLTKGFSNEYQYLVAQELTLGRKMGRDLSFSPDGNSIAVFGRKEGGRSLYLVDVLGGGFQQRIDLPGLDQQVSPAFSPDGRQVAFSGWSDGFFDIFVVDLETEEVTNLTRDEVFDAAPTFSPDGRSLVFSSVVGADGRAKLFRIDLANPQERTQLTFGDSNETDAIYSTVADRIYFTSDRSGGIENVFGLDLDTGQLRQYTDAVTGCFMPTVLAEPEEGEERLVYTSLWKGQFRLYVTDVEEPVGEPEQVQIADTGVGSDELPRFEPDIQVAISDDNKEEYGGFKLYLEGADTIFGIDGDQTLLGRVVFNFADYLGDRRLIAAISSVESFSNFDVVYYDLTDRLQWSAQVFDDRVYSLIRRPEDLRIDRDQRVFRQTGAVASLIYPFSFYNRGSIGLGYMRRELDGDPFFFGTSDDFPFLQGNLVRDASVFSNYGPVSGHRIRLDGFYAPDLDDSGILTASVDIDARKYIPVTRRSNIAMRGFYGLSESDQGNVPSPIIIGGIDTIRGLPIRSLAGDRAFFANLELRFPLIDVLATPVIGFQGIRGVLFADVGSAWLSDFQDFDFYDSDTDTFVQGVASYGFGITVQLFGLDFNWDFAKLYNPNPVVEDFVGDGFQTELWIGRRF
jgi:Tol biopolymer transport system component